MRFAKRIGAVEVYVGQALLVYREGRTLARSIVIDTALTGSVIERKKKRTLEQNFATVAAMVAFALAFCHLLIDIALLQSDQKEPSEFPRSEFKLLNQ